MLCKKKTGVNKKSSTVINVKYIYIHIFKITSEGAIDVMSIYWCLKHTLQSRDPFKQSNDKLHSALIKIPQALQTECALDCPAQSLDLSLTEKVF